eukprot:gene5826-7250_t
MKIARPLSNLFKKSNKKRSDHAPLTELFETRFKVEQYVNDDDFSKGKFTQHRVLSICEEGIKIITQNESDIIDEIPWSWIHQFNLKESWTEWEIALKDRRRLYFKCERAFDLHMATDQILDGLIRNYRSNDFVDEF